MLQQKHASELPVVCQSGYNIQTNHYNTCEERGDCESSRLLFTATQEKLTKPTTQQRLQPEEYLAIKH